MTQLLMEPRSKKLLDQMRDTIRLKHYPYRTEETYVQWARRYILFYNKRHPNEMGQVKIEAFLTHLAVQEQIAASTQNQVRHPHDLGVARAQRYQSDDGFTVTF